MKRLIVALIMCLMMASPVLAKEFTAVWTYPTEFVHHVETWNIYYSVDQPGGPYEPWAIGIPYAPGGPDYKFVRDLPLVPGTHTYYFIGIVGLKGGGETEPPTTNEASCEAEFALPPMTNFSVTITE